MLIGLSKYSFSQDCFLCVKKVAERSFLGVFWPLGSPTLVKISCPDTSIHIFLFWIQIFNPCLIWSSRILASRQWRGAQGGIFCFVSKNLPVSKIFPIFLKFGLEFPYEVLCCAKEDSTKIQSRSCSFASFSSFVALLNFAFRLLILALELMFRAS